MGVWERFSISRLPILGVPIDFVGMEESLRLAEGFLRERRPRQIITANPLMILAAEKDPGLRAAFAAADLVVPDGVGVVFAALLRGHRLSRVPGIELMDRLCARAAETSLRVFLLGAAPGVAASVAKTLIIRHPGLNIVGVHHGFFSASRRLGVAASLSPSEDGVVSKVREARPDILFVALAVPFQDAWVHANIDRFGAKVVMGVGGSFDVLSGRLGRAPRWMQSLGLEWLFRLAQEPRRIRRMLGLPVFLLRVIFC